MLFYSSLRENRRRPAAVLGRRRKSATFVIFTCASLLRRHKVIVTLDAANDTPVAEMFPSFDRRRRTMGSRPGIHAFRSRSQVYYSLIQKRSSSNNEDTHEDRPGLRENEPPPPIVFRKGDQRRTANVQNEPGTLPKGTTDDRTKEAVPPGEVARD